MRLTAEDNRPRSGGMGMRASQIFIQPISSSTRTAAAAAFAANAAPKEKVGFHANGGLEQQITNEPKFLRCLDVTIAAGLRIRHTAGSV
jgi:hypothetical protein